IDARASGRDGVPVRHRDGNIAFGIVQVLRENTVAVCRDNGRVLAEVDRDVAVGGGAETVGPGGAVRPGRASVVGDGLDANVGSLDGGVRSIVDRDVPVAVVESNDA